MQEIKAAIIVIAVLIFVVAPLLIRDLLRLKRHDRSLARDSERTEASK